MRRAAQARLNTRRARMSGAQENGDQCENTACQPRVRRRASRAPFSPASINDGSQANSCRATANARLGLGRFQGSSGLLRSMDTPDSIMRPPRRARPISASLGRKSRGVAAKPSARGHFRVW